MVKAQFVKDVKGLGKIVICPAPLPEQLMALREAGARYPISIRDCAYIELYDGSQDGTRTRHASICAKDSPIILAMVSPLVEDLKMARQATKAHKRGTHFVTHDAKVYDKYAESAEVDKNKKPEERRAIFLPERKTYVIQKGSEIAQVLFQDVEEQYFDKFARDGIKFHSIDASFVDAQKGTTINYLWFGHTDGPVIDNYTRVLHFDSMAFGVLKETGGAGLAVKLPVSKLEKIVDFLGKLTR